MKTTANEFGETDPNDFDNRQASEPAKPKQMNEIDVSHHNGVIDWAKVKTNPVKIDYVYLKATEGSNFTDPKLKINATGAKNAGFKIGYYHFATLTSTDVVVDANSEADYFLKQIKTMPAFDLPLILDVEINTGKLSKASVLLYINTFFARIKTVTNQIGIYSGAYFLNENLPDNHGLGNIPLWVAQYNNNPAPVLPKGWNTYWFWQYTDKATVAGITGGVDMSKSKP